MERFRFADQGPLPRWVRIWRVLTIPAFVVVGYLTVFVELTPGQSVVVFVAWAVVAGVPALDWMRRIHEQERKPAK